MRAILFSAAALALLSACASAPRDPAAKLADAGMKATGALGTDIREMSARLQYADVTDAFTGTLSNCEPSARECAPFLPPAENYESRQKLAKVIALRARALDALGKAYSALNEEAAYDGRADLAGATDAAVSGVNIFASAVAALPGAGAAASLITEPIAAGLSFGAGLIGESKQRRRILAASRVIGAATERMRDALKVESEVFAEILEGIQDQRAEARTILFNADLISAADLLQPMAEQLDVKFVSNADALIARSPRAKAAVIATMQAMSRAEVAALQSRYRSSVAALDGLLEAHADLERKRPISLADVERSLAELDMALDRHLSKEGE
jgi:hypothetical protein